MNKNVSLEVIKTNKYKSVSLFLYFSSAYNAKKKAALMLLGRILGEQSEKYPTKEAMSRARDMLYGMDISRSLKSRGNNLGFMVKFSFLNPRFVDISYEEILDYIKEVFFHTLIDEKIFEEAKRNIADNLARRMELPQKKSLNKVIELISQEDEAFSVYQENLTEEVLNLSLEDVLKEYENILNRYRLDIFVIGDVKDEFTEEIKKIDFRDREGMSLHTHNFRMRKREDIIEEANISQSYLNVVFNTPYNFVSDDFFKWVMANVFLGLAPTSLLFMEVRERLSLCYSISITDYKNEGIIRIHTDIDADKMDIVKEEIFKQIDRIIRKDYDLNQFEMTKALFVNIVKSTVDDLDAYIDFMYQNKLYGRELGFEEYAKKIEAVTADDIAEVFRNNEYCFTYMLKGVKNA